MSLPIEWTGVPVGSMQGMRGFTGLGQHEKELFVAQRLTDSIATVSNAVYLPGGQPGPDPGPSRKKMDCVCLTKGTTARMSLSAVVGGQKLREVELAVKDDLSCELSEGGTVLGSWPDLHSVTDEMAMDPTPPPPPPSFRKVEPRDDLEFAESPPRPTPPPSYAPVDFDAPPVPPQQPILAQSTVSAVESAFNSLAHTVLSSNARTLEDLVKEMLRPMLKSWLDDNLPGMVERIVKAEIERVSRGGR